MSQTVIPTNTDSKKPSQRQLLLLSDICLIVVAMLWGSSYGFAKVSLQYYPVLGFLAIRFGLTSLLLRLSLLRRIDAIPYSLRKLLKQACH